MSYTPFPQEVKQKNTYANIISGQEAERMRQEAKDSITEWQIARATGDENLEHERAQIAVSLVSKALNAQKEVTTNEFATIVCNIMEMWDKDCGDFGEYLAHNIRNTYPNGVFIKWSEK